MSGSRRLAPTRSGAGVNQPSADPGMSFATVGTVESGPRNASKVDSADLVRRQRADLQRAYLRGARRLWWDADRLAAERQRRLHHLLQWAADRSPFWRARLADGNSRHLRKPTSRHYPF